MDGHNEECKTGLLNEPPTDSIKSVVSNLEPLTFPDSNNNLRNDEEDANNNDVKTGWTRVNLDNSENGAEGVGSIPTEDEKGNKKTVSYSNKIQLRKSFQTEEAMLSKKAACLNNNNNNNPDCVADFYDERNFLLAMEDERKNNNYWKNENGMYFGDEEHFHMRYPWKRIAYIGVLLVLGITCAILALMKLCGGADWMNTATFSVIIMGTVMLLPPGLYYGRILICICCRCKDYTLWDLPAGPFG